MMNAVISRHECSMIRPFLLGLMILIGDSSSVCQSADNAILYTIQSPDSSKISYIFAAYRYFGESYVDTMNNLMGKFMASDIYIRGEWSNAFLWISLYFRSIPYSIKIHHKAH